MTGAPTRFARVYFDGHGFRLTLEATRRPGGQAFRHRYPNGISLVSSYDDSERLTSIVGKKLSSGTVITSHSYSYLQGTSDRALRQTMTVAASTTNPTAFTVSYGYDTLNRLTSATGGATNYSYAYDANGNMSSKTVGGTTTSYTVNAVNELTNTGYAYDANGNQTAGPSSASFTYNPKDQTSNLTRNGNNEDTTYFGQGQAQMTTKGSTLYHNDMLGMSIRNGSSTYDAFTRTPDGQPIDQRMRDKTTGTINRYYYLADGLGSIVALVDSAGSTTAVSTYKYDPYGNDAGTTGSVTSRSRFAGGYLSTSLGLYKFGERWYDPTIGRWQQQDMVDDPLAQKGWDRYDYAGDDPVNFVDPAGTFRWKKALRISAGAAVIGIGVTAGGLLAARGGIEIAAAPEAGPFAPFMVAVGVMDIGAGAAISGVAVTAGVGIMKGGYAKKKHPRPRRRYGRPGGRLCACVIRNP
jgi:RHS repeat-associated protein